MSTDHFKALEEIYPKIVKLMPDEFDSHDFIEKLAQKYQKLYIQALNIHKEEKQPFQRVHKAIAKRLKKHVNLVKHISNHSSTNIFGLESRVAVWRKVK